MVEYAMGVDDKKCTYSGSNRGPLACEANVITNYTTGAIVYLAFYSIKCKTRTLTQPL